MGETPVMDESTPRKRPRINRACAACRRRKIKCDGSQPCKACTTNELSGAIPILLLAPDTDETF